MSQVTQSQLERLVRQTQFSDFPIADEDVLARYQSRPDNRQTRGLLSDVAKTGLVSPLTEKSRVETSFVVTAGGTVYVPTQITMTDGAGKTVVLNFATPTMG